MLAFPIAISHNINYNNCVKINVRWLVIPITLVLIANLGWNHSLAQVSGVDTEPDSQRYFPETGHWVTGEFLETYQGVPNPIEIYGYPITEAYQEPTRSRIVQYFERTRFEMAPDNPPELRVQITPLGELLYEPGPLLPKPDNFPACRVFAETGFHVCYAFLDYFNTNRGAAQFGYPISNFEIQDGRIVQYFQRARFEWHPELPRGKRVTLTNLGRDYFKTIGEDPSRLEFVPYSGDNLPQLVLNLKVLAFSESAVLPRNGHQSIYIIVQDQNRQPVSNAELTLTLKLPSGQVDQLLIPGVTNENGVLKYEFEYSGQSPGVAEVYVKASYDTLSEQTVTSFRIWW